jgi:hypothetical protein
VQAASTDASVTLHDASSRILAVKGAADLPPHNSASSPSLVHGPVSGALATSPTIIEHERGSCATTRRGAAVSATAAPMEAAPRVVPSGTPLHQLRGVRDLSPLVEPDSSQHSVAHGGGSSGDHSQRGFFCRTSSSLYSLPQDHDNSEVQWHHFDNTLYGDELGNFGCLDSR